MTTSTSVADRPTALYRAFDSASNLLYVGITYSPEQRFASHALTKSWWDHVARAEITWYPAREQASRAEAVAILTENPSKNRAIPDEVGTYRVGCGRPAWRASQPQTRLLETLFVAATERIEADHGYKVVLAECAKAEIPIAHLASEIDVERKTIYRHLGRSMT